MEDENNVVDDVEQYDKARLDSMINGLATEDKENEPDYDPDEAEAEENEAEAKKKAAALAALETSKANARLIVGGFELAMQKAGHKDFELSEEKKQEVADTYLPLLQKYNVNAPAFFEKYSIELGAAYASYILITESFKQVKELKQIDAQVKLEKAKLLAEKAKEKAREAVEA